MECTLRELKWLKALLKTLGFNHSRPITLHCDSQAAIHIAAIHIEADCHQVRDAVQDGLIVTPHISTKNQIADLFTKALPRPTFEYLMSKLGVQNFVSPT